MKESGGSGLWRTACPSRSGLVPGRMTWLGLIGGRLLLIGNIGVLFDWWDPTSAAGLLVAPEFFWELSLGSTRQSGDSSGTLRSLRRGHVTPRNEPGPGYDRPLG